ncbi:cyclophilin-like fold protein [Acinetobacter tibetensis]|uniref:cyclophilin-like fold protein n=1 Tax=Acinetobacter tibetensis TaxID=2943497 RepID=UPI003A4D9D16
MNKTQYSYAFVGCSIVFAILLSCFALTTTTTTTAKPNLDHHPTVTRVSKMKIQIEVEGSEQPVFATLESSPTTQDFIKQLPLSLKLSDYASSEKIATLPHKLSTQSASKGYAGKTGDLSYYAPWGNLAIFYKDSEVGYANGLIFLGKMEDLSKEFLSQSELTVVIHQVKYPSNNE